MSYRSPPQKNVCTSSLEFHPRIPGISLFKNLGLIPRRDLHCSVHLEGKKAPTSPQLPGSHDTLALQPSDLPLKFLNLSGGKKKLKDQKCALISLFIAQGLPVWDTHTPHSPTDLPSQSQDAGERGGSPVRDGPIPGVPGRSRAGCSGAGPPGRAGLRVHSNCPRKRGTGGGERGEEKQTLSVCRRHKARFTKGAREGRRGLPGALLIPTPARGLGQECGPRIPRLGPAGGAFHVGAG